MLEHYLKLANISENSNDYIFRSICYCKIADIYKLGSTGHISSTRAREILRSVLDSISLDKSTFLSSVTIYA